MAKIAKKKATVIRRKGAKAGAQKLAAKRVAAAKSAAKKSGAKAVKSAAKKSDAKATKLAAKKSRNKVGKLARTAQKVVRAAKVVKAKKLTDLLDRRLLEIATQQYARLMREVAKGRKKLDRRIDDEKRIALQLGERIIAKAREVKEMIRK